MDIETAAQYSILPLAVAEETFYRVGGQPIAETDRINDDTVAEVELCH